MDWVRLGGVARRHWLFGLALAGGIAVRVLVMLAFRPIMWFGGDSASYLATGLRLVPDPTRVVGYGFFLWLLRPLHSLAVVAAVQHVMGLAIGVLIYLLARRYGLPGWPPSRCSSTPISSSLNRTRYRTSRSDSWFSSPFTCFFARPGNGGRAAPCPPPS